MLFKGENITNQTDSLSEMPVAELFEKLKNPSQEIVTYVRRLRQVRGLDEKQYGVLKRRLPYFVCAHFNPMFRRTENFAYTEYFVVDIDHISDKNFSLEELRALLSADHRVVMCFASPSEDGLKLLFKLSERCYDAGVYSVFYKTFVSQFARLYHLEQVIDARTSDVTRACFFSVDAEVMYAPDAVPVDMAEYLPDETDIQSFFDQKRAAERAVEELQTEIPERSPDPDDETMRQIRERLNPKLQMQREKPPVFVPELLNEIMPDLKIFIEDTGIIMTEAENINYGKQIRCKMGLKNGEVNLFCGKRGFTVVTSTKTGTNAELNDLLADVIQAFLNTKM